MRPDHNGQFPAFVFTPYDLSPGDLNLQSMQVPQMATTIVGPSIVDRILHNIKTW